MINKHSFFFSFIWHQYTPSPAPRVFTKFGDTKFCMFFLFHALYVQKCGLMFLADLADEFWLDLALAAVSVTHRKPNLFNFYIILP